MTNYSESANSNVTIENRSKISFSGVKDAGDFTEEQIVLYTLLGGCTVRGKNLKIRKLNLEEGEVIIEGNVISLIYNDKKGKENVSLLKRIFK